jgi:hypothetical protein
MTTKPHKGETVFAFDIPVFVHVVDGRVTKVVVDDCAPIEKPRLIEGRNLQRAVKAAENGDWPAWRFGY